MEALGTSTTGPILATMLDKASNLLRWNGENDEALTPCRRAVKTRSESLGDLHADTLESINNLASCLDNLSLHDEALPMLKLNLHNRRELLGYSHAESLSSLSNLASCMEHMAVDPLPTLALFKEAVSLRKITLGASHPATIRSIVKLAACMMNMRYEDQTDAIQLFEQAGRDMGIYDGEVWSAVTSPDAILLLDSYAKSQADWEFGERKHALPLLKQALEASATVLGRLHHNTLATMNDVAASLMYDGQFAEALPLLQRAVEACTEALGVDHPTASSCCTWCTLSGRTCKARPVPPPRPLARVIDRPGASRRRPRWSQRCSPSSRRSPASPLTVSGPSRGTA